ncbi:MAG: dTDP-4-dehydrorhamnose reductase [bacterium]
MKLLPKKSLVFGANGLLGQNVLHVLHGDYEIMAAGSKENLVSELPGIHYIRCDIGDREAVMKAVKNFVPNYIINAAAFTDVDGSETQKEACWKVNATAVGYLAEAALRIDARLIHVSTDYVFDGSAAPYTEESRPQPLGYYGRAKLAGENALLGSGAQHAIARTMVLYGSGKHIRPNFVGWLIAELRMGRPVRIVTDQFGNPTLASEFAVALRQLAESGRNGVYHICGAETISRYAFAVQIANVFELDEKLITPATTAELGQAARRPANSGFDISKAVRELGLSMSNVAGGLRKFREELGIIH